jgi:hypothetical protein
LSVCIPPPFCFFNAPMSTKIDTEATAKLTAPKSWVYVLELEGGNYYVGYSQNLDQRIKSHFSGHGSEWTRLHKPLKVCELFPDKDTIDEQTITLRYMQMYGYERVRGGVYCNVNLYKPPRELMANLHKCFICSESNHYSNTCPQKNYKWTPHREAIKMLSKRSTRAFSSRRQTKHCERCGRSGHITNECFATKHSKTHEILTNTPPSTLPAVAPSRRQGPKGKEEMNIIKSPYFSSVPFVEDRSDDINISTASDDPSFSDIDSDEEESFLKKGSTSSGYMNAPQTRLFGSQNIQPSWNVASEYIPSPLPNEEEEGCKQENNLSVFGLIKSFVFSFFYK